MLLPMAQIKKPWTYGSAAAAPSKFTSVITFVDGHSASLDFSQPLLHPQSGRYYIEPTGKCILVQTEVIRRSSMQKLKLLAGAVLAVAAVAFLVYQIRPGSANRVPTYDWQCTKCQHLFRLPVRDAASDRPCH